MLRDKEVQRIKDNLVRKEKLEEILKKHREFLAAERYLFTKNKKWTYKRNQKRKLLDVSQDERSKLKILKEVDQTAENNRTDNNNPNSRNEFKKEDRVNLLNSFKEVGKYLNDYNVENEFKDIIKKNFIECIKKHGNILILSKYLIHGIYYKY
jgi:hypothetical protein